MADDGSQESVTAPVLPTDEQLLSQYRHGDQSALNAIIERHEARLARIAYRITGCRDESEDVRHAVFVRFVQSIDQSRQLEQVGAWLARCTVNEALTRVRKRSRDRSVMEDLATITRSSDDSSPVERLQQDETREELFVALAQMTPDDRVLLSLRFDDDLTFREIGEVLERPASTVKSQVAQAIARLRGLLGKDQ